MHTAAKPAVLSDSLLSLLSLLCCACRRLAEFMAYCLSYCFFIRQAFEISIQLPVAGFAHDQPLCMISGSSWLWPNGLIFGRVYQQPVANRRSTASQPALRNLVPSAACGP